MSTYGPTANAPAEPAPQTRTHLRCVITKNTKGYQYETSVSVNYDEPQDALDTMQTLLRQVDILARAEIREREWKDDRA